MIEKFGDMESRKFERIHLTFEESSKVRWDGYHKRQLRFKKNAKVDGKVDGHQKFKKGFADKSKVEKIEPTDLKNALEQSNDELSEDEVKENEIEELMKESQYEDDIESLVEES